ncbi:helix-turn-helix domain-containing protein [Dactylosporangium sp. AC04546]|uniref:TetR/AcrR family transcriptional regulator n=1 Tax=Dactylosporangium sp. AC04546 TaxID=2862460 RepID=UPI001EE09455|nr:helix-turn-helix domain-containing protein [Dactylosporangium sp. AC04546]WVK89226.1 helix-turn-helix domain-containing protein [Dactylosporangium sp. AC04546]
MTVAIRERVYRAPRREAQATATREAIVAAAGRLFADQGWAPTTMAAVAAEAGVTAKSVYAVADKAGLLLLALERHEAERPGGDVATELLRHYPLCRTLEHGAAAEPALRDAWRAHQRRHRADAKRIVRAVADAGQLRAGLPAGRAADAVWSLVTWHTVALLVEERGWGHAKLARWLDEVVRRQISDG